MGVATDPSHMDAERTLVGVDLGDVGAHESEARSGDVDEALQVEHGGRETRPLQPLHVLRRRAERVPAPVEQLQQKLETLLSAEKQTVESTTQLPWRAPCIDG